MSVVVWDGETLAADMQGTNCDQRFIESKIRCIEGIIIAWTGNAAYGKILCDWYITGANPETWPEFQKDKDEWTRLIVADSSGCRFYERTYIPFTVIDKFQAWGSGRDYALGALAMGANAQKAVEVANEFCITCGLGVESYQVVK